MRHHIAIQIAGIVDHIGSPIIYTTGGWRDDAFSQDFSVHAGQILSLSAFSSAIDEGASISTSGVTAITLPADDMSLMGFRPVDIFGRLGAESLDVSTVRSTQTLDAGATTITLTSGSALSRQILHIGTEAIYPAAAIPASYITVGVTRGVAGTIAMPHRAALSGFMPRTIPVTTVPVEWVGRRVLVYVDGALWRIMVLTDNPAISSEVVTLSAIDVVNLLSVAKKASDVPAYATALAAQTIPLKFDLFCSRPPMRVGVKQVAAMTTTPAQLSSLGTCTGGTVGATGTRSRILYGTQWWAFGTARHGENGLPPLTLRLRPYAAIAGKDAEFDFDVVGGDGAAAFSGECKFGSVVSDVEFESFISEGARQYWLSQVFFGATTWWAGNNVTFSTPEDDYAAPVAWYTASTRSSPVTAKFGVSSLGASTLALRSRAAPQVGYVNWSLFGGLPVVVGIVSRRNLGVDERPEDIETGAATLIDGLYSSWQSGSINTTEAGPIHPVYGALPDYVHTFYAVRAAQDGDVHNVTVTPDGVVCMLDGFGWDRFRAAASIAIDRCEDGRWWEPGIYQIKTAAEIPLNASGDGEIEIRWQEPDDVWRRAVATVHHVSTSGGVSTYNIDQGVTMLDGSPCVGFGDWVGHSVAQITPPTFVRRGTMGSILARLIASSDSTSGRRGDSLGEGFSVPLSRPGYLSIISVSAAGIDQLFRFAAAEDQSYNEFVEICCRLSGCAIVGRIGDAADMIAGYGPAAVPIGRPIASEAVAAWSDDDLIGIPTTSDGYAGPVFSSYRIEAGGRTWYVNDWLAGDLLGQGDQLKIDLTPILTRPHQIDDGAIEQLVDRLRDRFGVLRRRWSCRVPIDIGIDRAVGDVVSISSAHLIDPAGGLGVTNRLARILSITHDFLGGACDVELIAFAEYGAGWNVSIDVTFTSISGSSFTFSIDGTANGTSIADQRIAQDLAAYAPTVNLQCEVFAVAGLAAGAWMRGYISAINIGARTVTVYRQGYISPDMTTAAYGTRCVLQLNASSVPAQYADLFQIGRDRLL